MSFHIVEVGTIEEMVEVDVRLCRTEDDRLVEETDTAARWLYCKPGDRIPKAEAIRYGLIKDEPVEESEAEPDEEQSELDDTVKQRPAARNKARAKTADKGA